MSRGFTMIELLVVVGIILILTAIILPVYSRARGAANTAAMLTQQHQITLALGMYMENNDGKHVKQDAGAYGDWPSKVLPYTKSLDILKNPQYKGSRNEFPPLGYGFAINVCLGFTNYVETENPIWLIEGAPYTDERGAGYQMLSTNYFDAYSGRLYAGAAPWGGKWLADSRNGGSVISFWDGSAKWVRFSSIPFRQTNCHVVPGEKEFFETMFKEK